MLDAVESGTQVTPSGPTCSAARPGRVRRLAERLEHVLGGNGASLACDELGYEGGSVALRMITLFHNVGSSHPVSARLMLGPSQLMGPFGLDEKTRNAVQDSLFAAAESLIACWVVRERLVMAVRERRNAPIPRNGDTVDLRNISLGETLRDGVREWLERFKDADRDARKLFEAFGYPAIGEGDYASYANQLETAGAVAEPSPLLRHLRHVETWIREILHKRNAHAHPGGRNGTLYVEDFDLDGDSLTPPRWRRGEPSEKGKLGAGTHTEVAADINLSTTALLEFIEENLVHLLQWRNRAAGIQIRILEIPEDRRDPVRPERFEATL